MMSSMNQPEDRVKKRKKPVVAHNPKFPKHEPGFKKHPTKPRKEDDEPAVS